MALTKEAKWLCENASQLEKFSGKWVAFSPKLGLVGRGDSLARLLSETKRKRQIHRPFVFHVPSKFELGLIKRST